MRQTTKNKLDYLAETKALIKSALVEKGQTVSDTDTFRSYADKIKAIISDASETDVFPLQTLSGFASSEDFMGMYIWQTTPAPFSLTVGKTYFVEWDGTTYESVAQDAAAMNGLSGTVGLGDLSAVGGAGNGEPFIVGYIPKTDYVGFISFDTKTSHTVRIYQKASATSTDERVKYVTFMNGATELISYPVIVGDTVKNPATAGLIDTPTKEPTVSTQYTYSGWSLTDGGAADSAALANVTEDRTVYAAFTESARFYTVRFYDGDTLIHTEQVAYGGSSAYLAEKDGYEFNGWQPTPTNIKGDLDCYAQWSELPTFQYSAWDEVMEIINSGKAPNIFKVGDVRSVALSDGSGTVSLYIIGFNHDTLADGSGKAKITIGCSIFGGTMAWEYVSAVEALPAKIANQFKPLLPTDIQNSIKTVTKSCQKVNGGVFETGDIDFDLFPLAYSEMKIQRESSLVYTDATWETIYSNLGAPYEYFENIYNSSTYGPLSSSANAPLWFNWGANSPWSRQYKLVKGYTQKPIILRLYSGGSKPGTFGVEGTVTEAHNVALCFCI